MGPTEGLEGGGVSENLTPTGIRSLDSQDCSESLYGLSYAGLPDFSCLWENMHKKTQVLGTTSVIDGLSVLARAVS